MSKENKSFSIEVEKKNTEMLYNRIKTIFDDIYGEQNEFKKGGSIETVIILVLREKGLERLNSRILNLESYYKAILNELKQISIILEIHELTGRTDFSGMKKYFEKSEDVE